MRLASWLASWGAFCAQAPCFHFFVGREGLALRMSAVTVPLPDTIRKPAAPHASLAAAPAYKQTRVPAMAAGVTRPWEVADIVGTLGYLEAKRELRKMMARTPNLLGLRGRGEGPVWCFAPSTSFPRDFGHEAQMVFRCKAKSFWPRSRKSVRAAASILIVFSMI